MRNASCIVLFVAIASTVAAAAEPTPFPSPSLKPYFAYMPYPNYPELALLSRRVGKVWFELSIDRQSGKVRQVKVLKSTGVKILDDSVAAAFLQWRAKPGLLQHAVIPVEFQMESPTHTHMMP
jgi:TonB family protein